MNVRGMETKNQRANKARIVGIGTALLESLPQTKKFKKKPITKM